MPGEITLEAILKLFEQPLFELVQKSFHVLKQNFDFKDMEFCKITNIKAGGCPEDCAYCAQSGHFKTQVKRQKLLQKSLVLLDAKAAKEQGASRFCMGGAYRFPPEKDFIKILEIIQEVKALGLETCVTLGMLNHEQCLQLKRAGLDYYNHNLDTSPDYYKKIITTRTFEERLETLKNLHIVGINICCGAIFGMGESVCDRAEFIYELTKLPQSPKSIPINLLIPMEGTPLAHQAPIEEIDFIKAIAVTRILFPKARVRLSGGRYKMSKTTQAWCFMAGANSIWIGDDLLTVPNSNFAFDLELMQQLQINVPKHDKNLVNINTSR